jgi:hypothetical protein
MSNIVLKAPPGVTTYQARDGTQYSVVGGLLTLPIGSQNIQDAQNAGFSIPNTFGAVAANITAKASGVQANATQLSYGFNQIATVASAADGVVMPAAVPGEFVTVINDGANVAQLFGLGADTINGVTGSTGIVLPLRANYTFSCAVAGQWKVDPASYGSQGLFAQGPVAGAFASNGNTQGNGAPITARLTRLTTVSVANGAVTLPGALPGDERTITNANTANAANVYPAVNETITGQAANAALNLAANKTARFSCTTAGIWDAILTA